MLSTTLPSLIRRETIELDRLVKVCLERFSRRDELVRFGAEDILADSLASCLHGFYTGLERVFEAVIRNVDGVRGGSAEWQRELLQAASVEVPGLRPPVLSEEAYQRLEEYRAFRHALRHLYTHSIDPARIFALMESLDGIWALVRIDLEVFLDFLESGDGR